MFLIMSETVRKKPFYGLWGTAPVVIGDDAFIGMNCVILKGVRLVSEVLFPLEILQKS